jgi:hypothetical protein
MIMHCACTRVLLKEKLYRDVIYFAMLVITGIIGCGIAELYDKITARYALFIVLLCVVGVLMRRELSQVCGLVSDRIRKRKV